MRKKIILKNVGLLFLAFAIFNAHTNFLKVEAVEALIVLSNVKAITKKFHGNFDFVTGFEIYYQKVSSNYEFLCLIKDKNFVVKESLKDSIFFLSVLNYTHTFFENKGISSKEILHYICSLRSEKETRRDKAMALCMDEILNTHIKNFFDYEAF